MVADGDSERSEESHRITLRCSARCFTPFNMTLSYQCIYSVTLLHNICARRRTMALLETETPAADLTNLGASELAAAIARGDVSALDAVEAHIDRIERVNGA